MTPPNQTGVKIAAPQSSAALGVPSRAAASHLPALAAASSCAPQAGGVDFRRRPDGNRPSPSLSSPPPAREPARPRRGQAEHGRAATREDVHMCPPVCVSVCRRERVRRSLRRPDGRRSLPRAFDCGAAGPRAVSTGGLEEGPLPCLGRRDAKCRLASPAEVTGGFMWLITE